MARLKYDIDLPELNAHCRVSGNDRHATVSMATDRDQIFFHADTTTLANLVAAFSEALRVISTQPESPVSEREEPGE